MTAVAPEEWADWCAEDGGTCPDCIRVRTDYYPVPCRECCGYKAKENAA